MSRVPIRQEVQASQERPADDEAESESLWSSSVLDSHDSHSEQDERGDDIRLKEKQQIARIESRACCVHAPPNVLALSRRARHRGMPEAPKLNAKQYQSSIGPRGGPVGSNAVLDRAATWLHVGFDELVNGAKRVDERDVAPFVPRGRNLMKYLDAVALEAFHRLLEIGDSKGDR